MLGGAWLRWRGASTAADRATADVRGVLGGIFVIEAGFPFRRGGAGGTFRGFGVGGGERKSNWYEGQLGGLSSVSLSERRCIQSQIEYTGR